MSKKLRIKSILTDISNNITMQHSTTGILPLDRKFVTVNMTRPTMNRVTKEVREALKSLGTKGETYNDVLERVLEIRQK